LLTRLPGGAGQEFLGIIDNLFASTYYLNHLIV